MFDNYDDILTVSDLMNLLCIGKNTAYGLLNAGEVKAFKIGNSWRIPVTSINDFILYKTNTCSKLWKII